MHITPWMNDPGLSSGKDKILFRHRPNILMPKHILLLIHAILVFSQANSICITYLQFLASNYLGRLKAFLTGGLK